jgi:hypothetical protein
LLPLHAKLFSTVASKHPKSSTAAATALRSPRLLDLLSLFFFASFWRFKFRLAETLAQIEAAGTFKHERVITSSQEAEV